MPKGFTEREKEIIKKTLIDKGQEFLIHQGIRKTSVEDLTRAAGISKGAFYIFYNSKEELFFDILEQYGAEANRLMFKEFKFEKPYKESFRKMLKFTADYIISNPVMLNFKSEDVEYLMRKLPEERIRNHKMNDDKFVVEFFEYYQKKGIIKNVDAAAISALFQAVFYLIMHKDDIGSGVFPGMMDLLINMAAEYMIIDEA